MAKRVTMYECSICTRRFDSKKKATRCEAQGVALPRYLVGDKVRFDGWGLITEGTVLEINPAYDKPSEFRHERPTSYLVNMGSFNEFVDERMITSLVKHNGSIVKVKESKRARSWKAYLAYKSRRRVKHDC